MALQIQQEGAIERAAPKRKIVYTQDARRGHAGQTCPPDETQEGIWAGTHPYCRKQAGSGFASYDHPDQFQYLCEAGRLARIRGEQTWKAFGEHDPLAGGVVTEEPPDPQLHPQRQAMPGQIGDLPNGVGVDPGGTLAAKRAAGLWGRGGYLSGHRLLISTQPQQMESRGIRQDRSLSHCIPPNTPPGR